MPKLIIPVGIPGCGKSTWAAQFFSPYIVSTDAIRLRLFGDENNQDHNDAVFDKFHRDIEDYLQLTLPGSTVVADATNLDNRARTTLRAIGKLNQAELHLIYFTNLDEAIMRNRRRERVVPMEAMERMMDKWERFRLELPQEAHLYNSITEIRSVI